MSGLAGLAVKALRGDREALKALLEKVADIAEDARARGVGAGGSARARLAARGGG
jgi:hypothetical protein